MANEVTKILHGKTASENAEKTAKETFVSGGIGSELPEINIKKNQINEGISLLDFLSNNKITHSKSEARRLILNKGVKLNNVVVEDVNRNIQKNDFKEKSLKISYGKKKHYLIKIN